MAEVKHRCRLYFQFPAESTAKIEAQLAQAMGTADAASVLLCGAAGADEAHLNRLVDLVQAQGLACLVESDAALAERLGADGVHIAADQSAYLEARKILGEGANVGADCGLSRHDAMLLAELGAEYVAFGSEIDAIDQCAELIAWWSEISIVPCVAWNFDRTEDIARFAALGADFVAPPLGLWGKEDVQTLIAEFDNALLQARRAA